MSDPVTAATTPANPPVVPAADVQPPAPAPSPAPGAVPEPVPEPAAPEPVRPTLPKRAKLPDPKFVAPNTTDEFGLPVMTSANSVVTSGGTLKRIPAQHIYDWKPTFKVCAEITYPETDKLQAVTRRTPLLPFVEDSAEDAAIQFAQLRSGMTLVAHAGNEGHPFGLVWDGDLKPIDKQPATAGEAQALADETGMQIVGLMNGKLALAARVNPIMVVECKSN